MRRIGPVLAIPFLVLGLLAGLTTAPANAATKYAALVLDVESGKVLFSRHADDKRHPASLTKIMTLYMVFEALEKGKLSLNQRLTASARAEGQACSCLGLRNGDTIQVRDAIKALVTKSANDVAVVVAEALGGTEYRFAVSMTERARELGMNSTRFMNASGLHDSRQVTTARDMARLAIAIRRDFPGYYSEFSTRSFTYKGRTYTNHNKLLGHYEGTDGIKTGYINASGFNLVASVVRDGSRLIGVVFGGESGSKRNAHMRNILTDGFKQAEKIRIASFKPPLPVSRPTIMAAAVAPTPTRAPQLASALTFGREDDGATRDNPEEEVGSRDDSGAWGVQVGAYSTEVRAQRSIATARGLLPSLLNDTEGKVEPLTNRDVPIYRARLIGLLEKDARSVCLDLKRRKLPCVPVPAGG
ncbi:serine hydrolase [Thalassobaculum sp.]|uniref:serine hydrolase n=1 Tax=Thalassobaculum sp. TaxID=2022740 RepID=UPI003B5C2AFE